MIIEQRKATRWIKCCCCEGQIRTDEKYLQVVKDNGKDERGEKYCPSCEKYARLNNEIDDRRDSDDDGERGLRDREAYAAYQAAGASSEYWSDRDAGFA
jgi:hypothetical protein